MPRYCLALDLKQDPELIREYELYHEQVWPGILASIQGAGILQMEIYRVENRLFMIMETKEGFSFPEKAKADEANEEVQRWEKLMWKYQQAIPGTNAGEKWRKMDKIFDLEKAVNIDRYVSTGK